MPFVLFASTSTQQASMPRSMPPTSTLRQSQQVPLVYLFVHLARSVSRPCAVCLASITLTYSFPDQLSSECSQFCGSGYNQCLILLLLCAFSPSSSGVGALARTSFCCRCSSSSSISIKLSLCLDRQAAFGRPKTLLRFRDHIDNHAQSSILFSHHLCLC